MFRIATWNVGHAVHSKAPFAQQWEWFETNVGADLVVLTEAKPDYSICNSQWTFVHKDGGIGGRRRWGTSIGGFNVSLRDVTNGVPGRGGFKIDHHYPGYVTIADLIDDDDSVILTVVGVHAPLTDRNGKKINWGVESVEVIMEDLQGLVRSSRGEHLVIAGDLNVHPLHVPPSLYAEFVDVVEASAHVRGPLKGCVNCGMGHECGHLWTHRNTGGRNPSVQNLDYIFVSEALLEDLTAVGGGDGDFPEVWNFSDHAPVVADFGDPDDDDN